MQLVIDIFKKAADLEATDIHLVYDLPPIFRIKRKLEKQEDFAVLNEETLNLILYYFTNDNKELESEFKTNKKLDISFENEEYRYRINMSVAKGTPIFCIRLIKKSPINIEKLNIRFLIDRMKKIKSGIVLVTGKVNSGKSTTMNALIQEVNREEVKKIIALEDPIEYVHTSDKSVIVQKEVSHFGDINSFYDGLVNVLREDSDIVVVGEIRDKYTMQVAIDLAESGQLVVGTLHTRSCSETIDRIINMYDLEEQNSIKYVLSSVLKLVASQRLIIDLKGETLLVPEVMQVDTTIGSIIRKDKFSVSELEDAIHTGLERGCISLDFTLAKLFNLGRINMDMIYEIVDKEKLERINRLIVQTKM